MCIYDDVYCQPGNKSSNKYADYAIRWTDSKNAGKKIIGCTQQSPGSSNTPSVPCTAVTNPFQTNSKKTSPAICGTQFGCGLYLCNQKNFPVNTSDVEKNRINQAHQYLQILVATKTDGYDLDFENPEGGTWSGMKELHVCFL